MTRLEALKEVLELVDTCWDEVLDQQDPTKAEEFDRLQGLIERLEMMYDVMFDVIKEERERNRQ